MIDVQHEKYARLMDEINALEGQVTELEASGTSHADLKALLENLAEARNKLSNLSNGCGHVRKPGE
jgi:prefoldin subunit 5